MAKLRTHKCPSSTHSPLTSSPEHSPQFSRCSPQQPKVAVGTTRYGRSSSEGGSSLASTTSWHAASRADPHSAEHVGDVGASGRTSDNNTKHAPPTHRSLPNGNHGNGVTQQTTRKHSEACTAVVSWRSTKCFTARTEMLSCNGTQSESMCAFVGISESH